MLRAISILAILAALVAAVLFWRMTSVIPVFETGVPIALAESRIRVISDLKYAVTLRVPAERQEPVRGRVTASFTLAAPPAEPVTFDFAQPADHLTATTVNGNAFSATVQNGHISIPRKRLKQGDNVVHFEFVAGDESLNRNEDFMYALFVPARASLALPCFDQPNIKARWTLTLDIPNDWIAVSNGRESGRVRTTDHASLLFDETAPIPPYLFAFAAGKFSVETATRDGRTLRMFHRETDAGKVARNLDAVFDLHARSIAWMETYTGIPYPFGKFDFIVIPSFQFSGMEHPGAIYYNANGVLLDESATQNQLLSRANTIAHETAHMWFGDLVTMTWFNDVWMKEVFANFMAAKIVNPSFPRVNHELRFLAQNYPGAYDVDRTDGANPIRQELANLNEAGSLYGAIIYQKAPIVMRQLERLTGADVFRDGVRDYLSAHAFGNAGWPDLIDRLDGRTPIDLRAWSHAWVEEAGRPTIRTDLQTANGAITKLALVQSDPRGRSLNWPQQLRIVVGSAAGVRTFDISLDQDEVVIPEAVGLKTPAWVLPVGLGLGYGFFDLDPVTLTYLTTSLHRIADPLTRGAATIALWEAMLERRVQASDVLRELLEALPAETDELNVQQLLDYARMAFWRFTAADDRAEVSKRLEPTLRAGLNRARSASEKAAWFSALRSVAITPANVEWLEQVWARNVRIPGLPLAETDEADLAFDLAVRDVPDAEIILATQLGRFQNPDRKARFAFITPAVSRDVDVRERFFQSLRDVANRKRESWVVDAARYLHHPLRAGASKILIRPALDLMSEIQKTGDIFFPKRWADATLSGYQSVQTAADIRALIDGLPENYPPRLRWVLLSAADPLIRAARLQQ